VLGVSCGDYRRHGAFAEYVAVPSRILYKLPDNLPFERAALIESVSIAVYAVSRHVPTPDDTVVVVGAGMIGLLVIQVLNDKAPRTSLPSTSIPGSWRSHNAWEPRAH
jgi:threonine dehydrogenase-like Zn-dependent dehydrogenase